MTPEQKAHQAIQREMGGLWHYSRHEDRFSPDIPDISFAYEGRHGWIEIKSSEINQAIKLRPGQINWLIKRGGHGFLIVRATQGGRHSHWVGVPNEELPLIRLLHRPTPDSLLVSLPNAIAEEGFRATLDRLLGRI